MKKHRNRRLTTISEINVVPYIDVMLVLLVIFMITTPLLTQGVEINLPHAQAKTVSAKQSEPLIVSIDGHGHYYLNIAANPEQSLSIKRILHRLIAELAVDRQIGHQRLVLVKGDRNVSYGKVVTAMVMMQRAGIEQIGLLTKPYKMKS